MRLGVKAVFVLIGQMVVKEQKNLPAHVADLCEKNEAKFKFLYESKTPLFKKIETIAKEIYRADEVIADTKIRDQLKVLKMLVMEIYLFVLQKLNIVFQLIQVLKGLQQDMLYHKRN